MPLLRRSVPNRSDVRGVERDGDGDGGTVTVRGVPQGPSRPVLSVMGTVFGGKSSSDSLLAVGSSGLGGTTRVHNVGHGPTHPRPGLMVHRRRRVSGESRSGGRV